MLRLLAALIISATPWFGGQAHAQEKPVVVSSFSVVEEWVQVIGGKGLESISISPRGSEAHGFQLSLSSSFNNNGQFKQPDPFMEMAKMIVDAAGGVVCAAPVFRVDSAVASLAAACTFDVCTAPGTVRYPGVLGGRAGSEA